MNNFLGNQSRIFGQKNEDFEQCVPVYFDFPGILARGLPRVN